MPTRTLGRTLVIANPASHSGKGAEAAGFVRRFLSSYVSIASTFSVRLTQAPGEGEELARNARDTDTVIALGGDGIIHEVVNGLMELGRRERPRLGIIPMGSGNDFARSLGIERNDPSMSVSQLVSGVTRRIDLGLVNETYFMETLSFGLDAAIALDTTERRKNHTAQEGAGLFATSGIRIFTSGLRGWPFVANVDGEHIEGTDAIFAVQNGPTYGGGFRVCPKASLTDGRLDLCYSLRVPSVPTTLGLFGLARFGLHTSSRTLAFRQPKHLEVSFPQEQPPCQVDGERLSAERYVVDVVPEALEVIVPWDRDL